MKGLIPKIGELICFGADYAKANSPLMLTGLAVGGVILTTVLTARAMPKALEIIAEEEEHRKDIADRRAKKESEVLNKDYDIVYKREFQPITKKDIIGLTWKSFVGPVLCCGLTIACIVGAHRINTVRQAAMAASYELLRNSFDDYRYHVKEALDKKKYEELEERIEQAHMERSLESYPVTTQEFEKLDVEAGAGIFVEPTTGHHFVSTYEQVYRAVDDVNDMLSCSCGGYDFVSLPTFLHMAGDKSNDFPKCAEHIGWMSGGFDKVLDRKHFVKPQEGIHKGHTCTLIVMATDIVLGEVVDRTFTR